MPDTPRRALTPDALAMIDAIARNGSFAAAARELGRVPSALTYSVRQLEEALDVLLFDRGSRQARLTAAGEELLREARRLLLDLDSVANRVRRVATGWESTLTLAIDDLIAWPVVLDLVGDFLALRDASGQHPGTRLRLRTEVMNGLWEALLTGAADLAIGVGSDTTAGRLQADVHAAPLGEVAFLFVAAPDHPLTRLPQPIADATLSTHRAVAVADSALRFDAMTLNLLPGQDVLTVSSLQAKREAIERGLGVGFLPEPVAREALAAGRLVSPSVQRGAWLSRLSYAWRDHRRRGAAGPEAAPAAHLGQGLQWWLRQLQRPATRQALVHGTATAPAEAPATASARPRAGGKRR